MRPDKVMAGTPFKRWAAQWLLVPFREDREKERIEKSLKEGNCFYLLELLPTFIQLWFEKCPLYSIPREIIKQSFITSFQRRKVAF